MGQKDILVNDHVEQSLDAQAPSIRVNGKVTIAQYKEVPHTVLAVSMEGTNVAADHRGVLSHDEKDRRGFYLHQLDIALSVDSGDYYIESDSPVTTMGGGEMTSSAQIQLDLSAGTFGPVPTTGVSGGIVIGSSFSEVLSDFKVVNTSEGAVAQHSYRMASTKEGKAYETPRDLVDLSAAGQWQGSPLFEVPDLAKANLPLISQVIFVSREPQFADLNLHVAMTAHLVYVEKTFEVVYVDIQPKTKLWNWSNSYKIPVSEVKVS
jgi:hypothetical protein